MRVSASVVAIALLQLLPLSAVAQPSQLFPAANGTIFPGQKALALAHPCSRQHPENVTGTWTPTSYEISNLERDLPQAHRIARKAWGQWVRSLKTNLKPDDVDRDPAPFFRQYGGLVIGGRKVIYVNAFRVLPFMAVTGGVKDWHSNAFNICDGGASFFGVEYDLESKTFGPFAFNGVG